MTDERRSTQHARQSTSDAPRCGICGREATVRINGRNYCEDHRDRGYSSALFGANAGDD